VDKVSCEDRPARTLGAQRVDEDKKVTTSDEGGGPTGIVPNLEGTDQISIGTVISANRHRCGVNASPHALQNCCTSAQKHKCEQERDDGNDRVERHEHVHDD
jgi:hypothetical protein